MCCDGEKFYREKKRKRAGSHKVQEEGVREGVRLITSREPLGKHHPTLTTYERKTQCNDPVTIRCYNPLHCCTHQ